MQPSLFVQIESLQRVYRNLTDTFVRISRNHRLV